MKRLVAVLMTLVLVLSLASLCACGKTEPAETTPSEKEDTPPAETAAPADSEEITQEMLESSKPNEYVMEKLAAGMEVLVACAMYDKAYFWTIMCDGIRPEVENIGCKWLESSSDSNVADLIENIENFATMGAALIIVNAPDTGSVQSTIETAQANGSMCLIYGEPADFTNVVRIDCYESAWQQMRMAEAWINEFYPEADSDPVHLAIMANSANNTTLLKTNAYQDFAKESPVMVESYFEDLIIDVDSGFTAAENAMTYDDSIRAFVYFDIGGATGGDNYLISKIDQGLNIDEFGIFVAGENNNTRAQLSGEYTEPTAVRGTVLDGETMYESIVDCTLGLLDGTYTTPYTFMQPIFVLCNFDYAYDSRLVEA